MLYFASSNLNVFGFDWAGACDNPIDIREQSNTSTPIINLVVPASFLCSNTSIESEIHDSLIYITTLMPNYATLSSIPPVYNDIITGYAIDTNLFFNYYYRLQSFAFYSVLFAFVSAFIVLGLSTPLFVTLVESIKIPRNGSKPKLYFHFWSSVLLIIIGVWGYGVFYNMVRPPFVSDRYKVYIVMLILMIVNSSAGLLIALLTAARGEEATVSPVLLFSAPLSECGCCKRPRCMNAWLWIMTGVGYFVILSFITYLLYATPTIVFVYYLYPTRTLIRVPFILGALFYTMALMSLVLHLFEKVSTITSEVISSGGIRNVCKLCSDLVSYHKSHVQEDDEDYFDDDDDYELRCLDETGYRDVNDYGAASSLNDLIDESDVNHTTDTAAAINEADEPPADADEEHYPKYSNPYILCFRFLCRCQCLKQCSNYVEHTEQQHIRNKKYFRKRLAEDLKIISGQCYLLISVLQLLAGVIVLVTFIFAELVLARLVFRQTNVTDINSLLALLPTVVFSVFTWFGRGLIFDVREDLKELNIPYFSKKETVEEKILREITALRILQGGRRLKRVKRKK